MNDIDLTLNIFSDSSINFKAEFCYTAHTAVLRRVSKM